MRAVIQRTINASVHVNNKKIEIDKGLLIFVGIETDDSIEDVIWRVK